jgi:hypothetical protein
MKLTQVLKVIKEINENLTLLDSVVDVDRIVGISNAQGKPAKLIRAALIASEAAQDVVQQASDSRKRLSPAKAEKKKKSPRKGGS